jgi:hypothetical protein
MAPDQFADMMGFPLVITIAVAPAAIIGGVGLLAGAALRLDWLSRLGPHDSPGPAGCCRGGALGAVELRFHRDASDGRHGVSGAVAPDGTPLRTR